MKIHPSSIIHEGAKIGADCFIGPYSVIGGEVTIGEGVRIDRR
jgi:UDP-N-acetylglucosamine acyltransferase